jgi:aminoglycoside phosphotransferase (APT) family kinase protein
MDGADATTAATSGTAERREWLAELLGRPAETIVPLGGGTDHAAFAVGDDLVARFARGGDAEDGEPADVSAEVEREAAVLRVVAVRLPVPTPEVAEVHADRGLLVTTRVAGESLLGRDLPSLATADALAEVLAAVHSIEAAAFGGAVGDDDFPLAAFAEEAKEHLAPVGSRLPAATRRAIATALGDVPEDTATATFVHNDFGAEHLFTDARGELTGVIDWADAALADPARDLARVLRDFGPGAYRRVVERYPGGWDDHADARAWFLARCAALEDVAFGITTGRDAYADAALRSLTRLSAVGA